MKPSQDSSVDNISSSSKNPPKRTLPSQQQKATTSKVSRQAANPTSVVKGNIEHGNIPSAKRLKTSHSSVNIQQSANMSRSIGIVTRPGFVDLTRGPSNFQPHAGAKKLVIKNLRTTSRADLEEYYEKTWRELDDALTAVFNMEEPSVPLEVLCRGVEATCRHGRAQKLFGHLKERCKTYLEKQLLPVLEREGAGTNVDALRAMWKFWSVWNEKSVRRYR